VAKLTGAPKRAPKNPAKTVVVAKQDAALQVEVLKGKENTVQTFKVGKQ
jgi:hypothetical protein